jgi:hypothetical protein
MSIFGKEAELFAQNYDVVEAMRKAWVADIQQFFETLFPEVEKHLGESLHSLHKPPYRYWWIKSAASKIGKATLWNYREYPELIRNKQVRWHVYLDIKSKHAPEATQSAWRSVAEPELLALKPKVSVETHRPDTFMPLTLVFHWAEDPVAETAPLIATALDILHRAALKVAENS